MLPADFIFLLERLLSPLERSMIDAIKTNQVDDFDRKAYADWLEEQGYTWASKMIREGYIPRRGHFEVGLLAGRIQSGAAMTNPPGTVTSGALQSGQFPTVNVHRETVVYIDPKQIISGRWDQ